MDRVDVQNHVPVQSRRLQEIEAGRIFQAEHELAVGQLVHADQLDFDDRPQHAAERGPELPAEPVVEPLKRPHLLFADAFGAFEVVNADRASPAVFFRDRCFLALFAPAVEGRQQRFHFGLTENVCHPWLRNPVLGLMFQVSSWLGSLKQ